MKTLRRNMMYRNRKNPSWSSIARKWADVHYDEIINNRETEEEVIQMFAESYRADILRYRAVARLGRRLRKYKEV